MIERISFDSNQYPPLLKEIPNPPKILSILGGQQDWTHPTIAIVGTRRATREGIHFAHMFARELAYNGFTVVSGLALGIDTAAHEGTLEASGKTVAVLGNGLDTIYPRNNEQLAKKIIQLDGCIISEYPDDAPAYPNQFLERNRIVAGISIATLVIEAPIRSGSIATARNAAEYGRDVFVIPGMVGNKNYEGSHELIRNGARLVTRPNDIFDDMNIKKEVERQTELPLGDNASKLIVDVLKNSTKPLGVDTIIEMTHLEPKKVQESLTLLALDGIIQDLGGMFTIYK